jgi:hypothetical protein
MVATAMLVKQGDLSDIQAVFTRIERRRAGRTGVRAPIGARKRGNARGAKGCREADA